MSPNASISRTQALLKTCRQVHFAHTAASGLADAAAQWLHMAQLPVEPCGTLWKPVELCGTLWIPSAGASRGASPAPTSAPKSALRRDHTMQDNSLGLSFCTLRTAHSTRHRDSAPGAFCGHRYTDLTCAGQRHNSQQLAQ
jgi:hypothetical protein